MRNKLELILLLLCGVALLNIGRIIPSAYSKYALLFDVFGLLCLMAIPVLILKPTCKEEYEFEEEYGE